MGGVYMYACEHIHIYIYIYLRMHSSNVLNEQCPLPQALVFEHLVHNC